jgi:hypothetical protein
MDIKPFVMVYKTGLVFMSFEKTGPFRLHNWMLFKKNKKTGHIYRSKNDFCLVYALVNPAGGNSDSGKKGKL